MEVRTLKSGACCPHCGRVAPYLNWGGEVIFVEPQATFDEGITMTRDLPPQESWNHPAIAGDLANEADVALISQWEKGIGSYIADEDPSLPGTRFRTEGRTIYLSPFAYQAWGMMMAKTGIDLEERRRMAQRTLGSRN